MAMTEEERWLLGQRIQAQRKASFGTKAAAYQAADVNSATWDRIEQGRTVREDRLRAAVRTLWPATEGDWRRLDEAAQKSPIRRAGSRPGGSTDPLDLITDWIQALEDRLYAVEEDVTELKEGTQHDEAQEPRTETGSAKHGGAGDGEVRPPTMTERVAAIEDEIRSLPGAQSDALIAQLRATAAKGDRDHMEEGRGEMPDRGA